MSVAAPPPPAAEMFGGELPRAVRYAELLSREGVEWGLIGPREATRIWERHLLNCAVLHQLIRADAAVVDVGSGAGLPGIPLALARSDLQLTLVEPLQRRVRFLELCRDTLDLPLRIERCRAEQFRRRSADVVVARAVAPLATLLPATLHLLRPGGTLLAMKGQRAEAEIEAAAPLLPRWPGLQLRLETLSVGNEVVRIVAATTSKAGKL